MPFVPQHQAWPGQDAILLVHGIGNDTSSAEGSEAAAALRTALGGDANRFAIYELQYDAINDWFAAKTQLAMGVAWLRDRLSEGFGGDSLGTTASEFAGDIIWPVLSTSARTAVRTAYLAQLQAMAVDGPHDREQRISIICHSLGCFHTYEALHAAIRNPQHRLRPSDDFVIRNVVFMASPVQLIRTVSHEIGSFVPDASSLSLLRGSGLAQPAQSFGGQLFPLVRNRWVSITGDLDPVGGHLLRARLAWAYMNVPGQESLIDNQFPADVHTRDDLRVLLATSLRAGERPAVTPQNPHDWSAYIGRHDARLREWLVA